jgi:hypothetical protein
MRELVRRFGEDQDRVVREYAAMEDRGEVPRHRNQRGLSSADYARRLWADAMKKGRNVSSGVTIRAPSARDLIGIIDHV